jgi:hypothetical protein
LLNAVRAARERGNASYVGGGLQCPLGCPVRRNKVTPAFDGGRTISDGGVMLLAPSQRLDFR